MLRLNPYIQRPLLCQVQVYYCSLSRSYHSYPDPKETPIITSARSEQKRVTEKLGPEFDELKKFSLENKFNVKEVPCDSVQQRAPITQVSKMKNGLTVASQELPGLMSSFALLTCFGSSFENQSGPIKNTGVTQMLEHCAFRSTYKRSHQELMQEIEMLGGVVTCLSSRENIMYCVDVLRQNAEAALDILADTVLSPKFASEELEESQAIMQLQPNELPSEIISRDTVQRAAYINGSLGGHHYCPADSIGLLDVTLLHDFRSKYLHGSNCVLAGAGIDHATFVKIAESKFSGIPKSPESTFQEGPGGSRRRLQRPVARYTGGLVKNERSLKEPYARLALAFEIGGWHDDQLVHACVLQQLLGGGSSFSAGGPGKGMYSRLYREVLNKNHWVESSESFLSVHEESGIFGIDGSCMTQDLPSLLRVFLDQLLRVSVEEVQAIELSRAKNMLKSMLLMQLESRLVMCEDIAKQLITYQKRDSPEILCAKIDAVTAANLTQFARRMLASAPSIGCVGEDLSSMPTYEQIQTFTSTYRNHLWKESPK